MFCKYKKRLSIVLCLTYILQFPFWFSLHFLGEKTEIFAWAFSVGFWGLNGFMLFLVDFFHVGLPKTGKAFVPFVLLLILSRFPEASPLSLTASRETESWKRDFLPWISAQNIRDIAPI